MVDVLDLFNQRRDTIEMLIRFRHLPDAFQLAQRFNRRGVFSSALRLDLKLPFNAAPSFAGGELLTVEIDQIFTVFAEIQKFIFQR